MSKLIDLTNMKFGRLLVVSKLPNQNRTRWHCLCDCGNYKDVLSQNLKNGHVRSCGCLAREEKSKSLFKHGFHGTRVYNIFHSMKSRCYNPLNKSYPRYGGRGITICDEWLDNPSEFCKWSLSNGYQDHLTIDRIDNDKGYSPDNCRWSDYSVQNSNKGVPSSNSTGFKGVSYNKKQDKYVAYIRRNKIHHHLGTFDTLDEAVQNRKKAESILD